MRLRRSIVRTGTTALLALLFTGCAVPWLAEAKLPRSFFGMLAADINPYAHSGRVETELANMHKAGVGVIRQEFDAHVFNNRMDAFVLAAARNRIHVVPLVVNRSNFRAHGKHRGYRPPSPAKFARFATRLEKRYGPKGSLWKGANRKLRGYAIRTWQLWNEPNLPVWWRPRPNPAGFAKLVKAGSRAIRRYDRHATIVSAGIPDSTLSKPYGYQQYLAKFLKAGGGRYINAVGVHAYSHSPGAFTAILRAYRRTLNAHHGRRLKLLITEVGWADKGHRNRFVLGPKGQARMVTSAYRIVSRLRRSYKIAGIFYFKWRDVFLRGSAGTNWGYHTGLIGPNGKKKRAYSAWVKAVRRLERR